MGLDIHIMTDNYDELRSTDYYNRNDYFNKHSLSRTFCNFICRQNVVSHEAELDQIGKVTGVDISPIYEMENYPDEEGLDFFISVAENEEEKQKIIANAEKDREQLQGNLYKILKTITELIEQLNSINNLPYLLLPTDFDTLYNQKYFADFNIDKGDGYIGNNFGQDLRNFKRFLEFSKEHGTTTVWFSYG